MTNVKFVCNGPKNNELHVCIIRKNAVTCISLYLPLTLSKRSVNYWLVCNTDGKASTHLTFDTFIFSYEIQLCILTGCIQLGTAYYS